MSFLKSFFYAFRGIVGCVCDQRNLRIHTVFSIYVLYFSQFYNLSVESMCILWLLIALVPALELMNTAVERACDAVTLEKSEMIKIAKDAAAGAVLVSSVVAVIIGLYMFLDTKIIWGIISFLCNTPEYLAIFIISMLFSTIFIVVGPRGLVENFKEIAALNKPLENDEITESSLHNQNNEDNHFT